MKFHLKPKITFIFGGGGGHVLGPVAQRGGVSIFGDIQNLNRPGSGKLALNICAWTRNCWTRWPPEVCSHFNHPLILGSWSPRRTQEILHIVVCSVCTFLADNLTEQNFLLFLLIVYLYKVQHKMFAPITYIFCFFPRLLCLCPDITLREFVPQVLSNNTRMVQMNYRTLKLYFKSLLVFQVNPISTVAVSNW